MNIFFAQKGSKLFFHSYMLSLQLVLCRVVAVKTLPALNFSADNILRLVLRNQKLYSENSKIVICLDSFSKQIYNIWVIFRLISVFQTTALLYFSIYSNYLWLLLSDLIGSLMRLL